MPTRPVHAPSPNRARAAGGLLPSVALWLLVFTAQPGRADEAATGLAASLEHQVRQLALDGSQAGAPGAARVEVSVGALDPRLRLAPCQRIEPYLPAGTRLWGRTRIGLRCLEGAAKWNVFLPITVKVYGRALVTTAAVSAGAVLSAVDLIQAEIDLAGDHSPAIVDPDLAIGRTLTQALEPGKSLRVAHLKARQWFVAGDTVKVLARGNGFDVAGEGQALSNGVEGQTARVRTESGRVLTGRPVGERQLELSL